MRPVTGRPRQREEMFLIGETGHAIVGLGIEMAGAQATLGHGPKQWQLFVLLNGVGACELMRQGGDKNSFSGARETCHAQSKASA